MSSSLGKAAIGALFLASCRMHTLEDGRYRLTVTEVIRDECGTGTHPLGIGTLKTEGHALRLVFADPPMSLIGSYKYGVEDFFIDGSLTNQPRDVNGQRCSDGVATWHLEASAVTPRSLKGKLTYLYDSKQAGCWCRVWTNVEATAE